MRDRIAEYVSIGKPDPYCDRCLAQALGLPLEVVERITEGLGETRRYTKRRCACSRCGTVSLAIAAV